MVYLMLFFFMSLIYSNLFMRHNGNVTLNTVLPMICPAAWRNPLSFTFGALEFARAHLGTLVGCETSTSLFHNLKSIYMFAAHVFSNEVKFYEINIILCISIFFTCYMNFIQLLWNIFFEKIKRSSTKKN